MYAWIYFDFIFATLQYDWIILPLCYSKLPSHPRRLLVATDPKMTRDIGTSWTWLLQFRTREKWWMEFQFLIDGKLADWWGLEHGVLLKSFEIRRFCERGEVEVVSKARMKSHEKWIMDMCMVHASSFCCVVSRSFFRCLLFLTSSIGGNGVEAESSSSKVSLALNFGSVTLCKCRSRWFWKYWRVVKGVLIVRW